MGGFSARILSCIIRRLDQNFFYCKTFIKSKGGEVGKKKMLPLLSPTFQLTFPDQIFCVFR